MTTIQRNFQARKYIAGPCPHLVSGILRALKAYPDIEFINDTEAEQFKVIIRRLYLSESALRKIRRIIL